MLAAARFILAHIVHFEGGRGWRGKASFQVYVLLEEAIILCRMLTIKHCEAKHCVDARLRSDDNRRGDMMMVSGVVDSR